MFPINYVAFDRIFGACRVCLQTQVYYLGVCSKLFEVKKGNLGDIIREAGQDSVGDSVDSVDSVDTGQCGGREKADYSWSRLQLTLAPPPSLAIRSPGTPGEPGVAAPGCTLLHPPQNPVWWKKSYWPPTSTCNCENHSSI